MLFIYIAACLLIINLVLFLHPPLPFPLLFGLFSLLKHLLVMKLYLQVCLLFLLLTNCQEWKFLTNLVCFFSGCVVINFQINIEIYI